MKLLDCTCWFAREVTVGVLARVEVERDEKVGVDKRHGGREDLGERLGVVVSLVEGHGAEQPLRHRRRGLRSEDKGRLDRHSCAATVRLTAWYNIQGNAVILAIIQSEYPRSMYDDSLKFQGVGGPETLPGNNMR